MMNIIDYILIFLTNYIFFMYFNIM